MSQHQVRVTIEDFGPHPWKVVVVDDIDTNDYDEKNLTVGSLVWDAWTMLWPHVERVLKDNMPLHDDMRVIVTFDNTYVADEHPNGVDADLFTATWVAQHDELLGVSA